jgi:alkylation response protein AidB-like acyl-CoA dehydrogenase
LSAATTTGVGPRGPETLLRRGGRSAVLKAADAVAADWQHHAEEHDRTGSFAPDNIAKAWEAGLGNLTVPAEHDGVGADLTTTAAALRRLGAGDPSSALILSMHLIAIKAATLPTGGWSAGARERLLASSLAGPALANHLRVEPELGTPSRGGVPGTRATRAAGGWRISGHKLYCTGSYGLEWLIVWAGTTGHEPGQELAGSFLVPADAPGVSIRETWDHLGMRASASHDMVFEDVLIPDGHALTLSPVDGKPPAVDPVLGAWMAVLVVSIYLGVADAARDWLLRWLSERAPANLGAPLASLPRFQSAVGEIEARLLGAGAAVESLARAVDGGGDGAATAGQGAGLVKVLAARGAIECVQEAVALTGNPGLSRGHPLERHLRDVLCSRIHTPQEDAVLLAAGRAALDRYARS